MTGTQAQVVLRQIRRFAAAGQAGQASDGELLERFAARREEDAFATLVKRHGPLVLGVCRRVLHDSHDAEDAFQATFLALARKAGSVGRAESVAGWLYRVAYHVAVKALARKSFRRRRERRAGAGAAADPLAELTGREMLRALDEELSGLSERLRAPLVLCYLEGKTRDEAAHELGWSLGTLKRRLEQARTTLQARLAGRGIALTALMTAGLGGTAISSAQAAATAAAALWAIPAGGRKLLAAAVLAVGLTAGAGLLIGGTPGAGAPATEPTRAAPADKPAPPAGESKETIINGRVVAADGKPAAGAHVALVGVPKSRHPFSPIWLEERVLAHAPADAEGRFQVGLADATRAKYQDVYAVAGQDGHGLTCERVPRVVPEADFVLRLAREKMVRGRVLDLQGLPVAGVEIRVEWIGTALTKSVDGVGLGRLPRDQFPPWPGPTTSGKDGRFVLRGLNPDFGGWLLVEGDAYAPVRVEIKPGAENRTQEINLTVAPAEFLEGVVTGEDTGQPIGAARVKLWSGGSVTADESGRFRVKMPAGGSKGASVTAPDTQPYLPLETGVDWPKGAIRHEVKFALKRGVLVRGKVTEAASGRPVAGAMVFDAAHLWTRLVKSGPDGTFGIAVAPGRGNLLVKGPDNDYVALQISSGELLRDGPPFSRLYPDALVPLDLKAGADPAEVSVKLRRGVTIRGRLLGPDGKPVDEAVLLCWNQLSRSMAWWFASPVAVRDGVFELRGCDPEETYPVHFLDAKHQWGVSIKVSAKAVGDKPLTVRLERCGRAVVRFVDRDGKPVPGVSPYVNIVGRPGAKGIEADSDFVANVDRINYSGGGGHASGADGRCTFPALIPGVTYRLYGPGLKDDKEVVVKAGETLQLPNIVFQAGGMSEPADNSDIGDDMGP